MRGGLARFSRRGTRLAALLADLSEDPGFEQGRWVRSRFCEKDIAASPELRVEHVRER